MLTGTIIVIHSEKEVFVVKNTGSIMKTLQKLSRVAPLDSICWCKTRNISGGCVLQTFTRSTFKLQCKKDVYFYLILVGIPSILILSVINRWVGFFLLNRQNLLNVTKGICQWSLIYISFYFSRYHFSQFLELHSILGYLKKNLGTNFGYIQIHWPPPTL